MYVLLGRAESSRRRGFGGVRCDCEVVRVSLYIPLHRMRGLRGAAQHAPGLPSQHQISWTCSYWGSPRRDVPRDCLASLCCMQLGNRLMVSKTSRNLSFKSSWMRYVPVRFRRGANAYADYRVRCCELRMQISGC